MGMIVDMEKGDSNDCFWEGKEGMGLIVGRTEGDGNNFEEGRERLWNGKEGR